MSAIEFNNVWEKYRIKFIRERKVIWEEVWVLEDVNFRVDKGEVLGIIGENGAGKTTLLKLIAGMLIPDRGKINVQGRVSTLMELGAGFNPEFTGRENILINARIYGLDEENLQRRIDKIIEFAELGRFIDAPIKYYSQGMYTRLAFALAIYVEPDILLIDDILAVGDEEAQQKCVNKVFELKRAGKTIIIVSHDMTMIAKLCNRVILLEKGKVIREGLPQKIIQHYLESVGDKKGIAVLAKDKLRTVFNNGKINISYEDNLLTKSMGGYVSFFIPSSNIWFPSFNLSWQIKTLSSGEIIAEGKTSDGIVSQIWALQLEDIQLKWQVEIKEDAAKEAHIDLFLVPQYKEWLTLKKNNVFPPFIHKFNWQDLGLNDSPEGMLGLIQDLDSEAQTPPSFILEREDKDSQIRLFNTGYDQDARVIQVYSSSTKFISLDVRIFSEKDKIEDYIKPIRDQFLLKEQESKRQLFLKEQEERQKAIIREQEEREKALKKEREELLKQQEEQARLLEQRTISSGDLRLFANLV
ncbi:MAG: ATP-binding cassette domain-containing protein [Candidatus Pacearchaeota archaeon]|nr:ATP-binding cassette domain-containing protein [Candidatus Pacearchaeota archaeon]